MNINQLTNLSFNARIPRTRTFSFRVPGKNDTTIIANVTEIPERLKRDITNITCETVEKGKVLEKRVFNNKKGFDEERLGVICEKIQQKVKEGYDFLEELFMAQFKG